MSKRSLIRTKLKPAFTGHRSITSNLQAQRNMSTDAKKALRKSMKSKLSALSNEAISQQSLKAQQQILNLPQYKSANRISIYLAMPTGEAQTDVIAHDAFEAGKSVFVPYIHRPKAREGEPKQRSVIEMLRLQSVHEYEGLQRDSWGIPSLPADGVEGRENAMGGDGLEGAKADEVGLDLIVVPGVAFDNDMNRLGHGAGFYDEYLTRYCAGGKRKKPFLVGLCLTEQYLDGRDDRIPTKEHDWRMVAIAIGNGRLVTSDTS